MILLPFHATAEECYAHHLKRGNAAEREKPRVFSWLEFGARAPEEVEKNACA